MNDEQFLSVAMQAITSVDYDRLESLRGPQVLSNLNQLMALDGQLTDREQRDAIILLVQDHLDDRLRPMMLAGLASPDESIRAIAVCQLRRDFGLFEKFLDQHSMIDAKLVDAEVARLHRDLS